MQSDVFSDVLADQPDLTKELQGFTYYPNTLGAAPTTYGALPTIHSGQMRPPGRAMNEYFSEAIQKNSFETELADDGWKVTHLNPIAERCADGNEACFTFDDVFEGDGRAKIRHQAAQLMDISMFRLAPPELKASVFNDDQWRFAGKSRQASLVEASDTSLVDFTAKMRRRGDGKMAKFLHLQSTHPPATRHADCSLLPAPITPMTRPAADEIVTCATRRLNEFAARLRELKLDASTSVIVLSDHGYLNLNNTKIKDDPELSHLAARANPALLIKPAGASGAFRTSQAELALTDVKPIVCTMTKACDERLEWDSVPPDRPRRFMNYSWGDEFWFASRLRSERHWELRGPMFDPSSWHDLGAGEFPTTTTLTFGKSDFAGFYGANWGPILDEGDGSRWGVGPNSTLNLRLPNDRTTTLSFDVATLPELADQTLLIKVNLKPFGPEKVSPDGGTVTFTIPPGIAKEDVDEIHLIYGKHRVGETDPSVNRHVRKQQQLAVRFDALRIR
jgi:hypothetical protein